MRAPEFDFLGIAIPRIFTAPNCTLGIVLSERNGFSYEYFSKTNPQMMHLTKHGTRAQLAIDVGLTANWLTRRRKRPRKRFSPSSKGGRRDTRRRDTGIGWRRCRCHAPRRPSARRLLRGRDTRGGRTAGSATAGAFSPLVRVPPIAAKPPRRPRATTSTTSSRRSPRARAT